MKKNLFLLALVSLTFAGCIKESADSKAQRAVYPGVILNNYAGYQMISATVQADYGVRLAVLLAEAAKQGKTDLDQIIVNDGKNDVNVKETLFGETVQIEKQTGGDYTITFAATTGGPLSTFEGVITVNTGGKDLLSDTDNSSFWSVTSSDKFIYRSYFGNAFVTTTITDGETMLYADGNGSYVLIPHDIRFTADISKFEAQWSSMGSQTGDYSGQGFRLTPPAEGLAFSDCTKKPFIISGAVGGPTIFSLDGGLSSTKMMYEFDKATYLSARMVKGTTVSRLTGMIDYNPREFVSDFVIVDYIQNEASGRTSVQVTYNGITYRM